MITYLDFSSWGNILDLKMGEKLVFWRKRGCLLAEVATGQVCKTPRFDAATIFTDFEGFPNVSKRVVLRRVVKLI